VKQVLKRTGTLVRLLTTPIMTFVKRHTANPRIQQLLGYPAVFLGSSPYLAPSMFHLMSYLDLEDGVLYAEGGFYSCDRLHEGGDRSPRGDDHDQHQGQRHRHGARAG